MLPSCGECHRDVDPDVEAHVARPLCNHYLHLHCALHLAALHRAACPACPPPAVQHDEALASDGYSINLGTDADVNECLETARRYANLQAGNAARAPVRRAAHVPQNLPAIPSCAASKTPLPSRNQQQ
jgi:hypothetical protein